MVLKKKKATKVTFIEEERKTATEEGKTLFLIDGECVTLKYLKSSDRSVELFRPSQISMKAERQPLVSVTTASDCLFKLSKQDRKGFSETTAGGGEGKNKKDINSLVGAVMCYYTNNTT